MTGVVLAGGKSTRMGVNKALVRVGEETLLERVVGRLAQVAGDVVVVVADEDWVTPALGPGRVKVVADVYPGRGSLGGLYTGLREAQTYHSLVVACDMPFLNVSLLRYLAEVAVGYDVAVPRLDGTLQPLCAVYSQRCRRPIERLLRRGRLKIIDFFGEVRVRYITEAETTRFDPHFVSFFNINTPGDLVAAEEIGRGLGA